MSSVEPVGTSTSASADLTLMPEYLVMTEVFKQALQPPAVDDEDGDASAAADQVNGAIAMDIAKAVTGFGA